MNARDAGFGLAVALAALGLLAVWTPLVEPAALEADQLRSLVAMVALAGGVALLRRWYRATPATHEPPERERPVAVDPAGTDVGELLALGGPGDEAARFYRSQARERLEAVAVAVLATHRGLDESEARARLAAGTWTDDGEAARFFVVGADSGGPGGAVARRLGGASTTERRAGRAIAELRRVADAEVSGA